MTDMVNILNTTGDSFCSFALTMFIQSGILIVLLYAIDLIIRKHVRAVFRYCIWMLVFVKLVLPVSLSSPVGMGQLFGDKLAINKTQISTAAKSDKINHKITVEMSAVPAISKNVDAAGNQLRSAEWTREFVEVPIIPVQKAENVLAESIPVTWQAVVFLLWLVGLLVLSVLLFQRFLFVKILLAQSDRANGRLDETLQKCHKLVGVRKKIELRLSKSMLSPAVCGLSKPIILMPAALLDDLSEEKLRAVLIHELAHIKRGDLWVNFMQTILQIIYFYNPLLWFANTVIRGIREKAVDEMVLTKLGDKAKTYSTTLLDIAEIAFSKPHFSLRLVGVVESKKALSSRIKHILTRPMPKSAKLGLLGLATIIITAAVLLPMAKAGSGKSSDKFIAVMDNGVTVELLGICEHPSEGKQWWAPDGTPLGYNIETVDRSGYTSDYPGYEIIFRKTGTASFKISEIKGCRERSGISVTEPKGLTGRRAHIKPRYKKTNIKIASPSGKWKTIIKSTGGGSVTGKDSGKTIVLAAAEQAGKDVIISCSNIETYKNATRIIAVDSKGKELKGKTKTDTGVDGLRQRTIRFANLDLSDIKEFKFQTCPYQYHTFKNIALRPDKNWTYDLPGPDSLAFGSKRARIVDARGNAVAGALIEFGYEIKIEDYNGSAIEKLPLHTPKVLTDSKGRFPMPALDTITSAHNKITTFEANIKADGFIKRRVTFTMSGKYPKGKGQIDLARPSVIKGTLLDPAGKPLANAPLSLETKMSYTFPREGINRRLTASTDEQGFFIIEDVPPGIHLLSYPDPYSKKRDLGNVCGAIKLKVRDGQEIDGVVLDLSKSTSVVKGRIIDEKGFPIKGVTANMIVELKIVRDGGSFNAIYTSFYSSKPTDATGVYSLKVPPGEWFMNASYPYVKGQNQITSTNQKIYLNPNQTKQHDITLKRHKNSKKLITEDRPAENTSAEAAYIIQKILDRYAAINTYSAVGEVVTDVKSPPKTPGGVLMRILTRNKAKQLKSVFSIKMARPNLYCIEWDENVDTRLSKIGNAWSLGDGSFALFLRKGKNFEDPLRALISAQGMGRVESSLFFDTSLNVLRELRELSQEKDEYIESVDCYVISGKRHRATYTFWVSKKDFLIHRHRHVSGGGRKNWEKNYQPDHSDKNMKRRLERSGKEATSEEIAKTKAKAIADFEKSLKIQVTRTQTYRNIILDQPISKEQFQPSKDIKIIRKKLTDLRIKYIDPFKNVPLRPGVKTEVEVENQAMDRTFYFKLPLAQPRFHWKFTDKDLYLSGRVVLRIIRDDQVNEIVVFDNGKITEGWGVMCSERGPQDNAVYFGFQSTTKYSTKPSDKVELELIAKDDLDGIGRLQTGVLKAGTHKAEGKLKIYAHSDKARAYIEWQNKWLLDITSEKGWMNSEIDFFINDNGTMRPLTKAEKKRIYSSAKTRSFRGSSDISFMENVATKNDNENHFRKIRTRIGSIDTRIDITEFTDDRQEQVQSKTTMVSKRDSIGRHMQRFEHSRKKVFVEDVDFNSDHDIFKFGRIDHEIAIKIRVLCDLYENDNQAELYKTATTFNDAADVDQFQLINLKDNSIVYAFELNKMDWGLCRKIQWYNKSGNTLSKSIEYANFNRPVEFKTLADPGDSGYLLPYKTVRRYFDNDGNEEKTETLEIFDAAMASRRRKHDYDVIRQNYGNDFDIEIPDDYTIIDKRKTSKNVSLRPDKKMDVPFSEDQFQLDVDNIRNSKSNTVSSVDQYLTVTTFGNKKISLTCGSDLITVVTRPDPKTKDKYGTAKVILSAELTKSTHPKFTWEIRVNTAISSAGGPTSSTGDKYSDKKLNDLFTLNIIPGTYPLGKNINLGTIEGQDLLLRIDKLLHKADVGVGEAKSKKENLQAAIVEGDIDEVEKLIEEGADVNAKDKINRSPLHFVKNKTVAELLIAKGANVNARTKDGSTLLHTMAWNGNKEMVELLLENGADVNARHSKGHTPLHFAVRTGKKEVVKLLLANGALINTKDEWGYTPLHWANKKGYRNIAELLLANGADASAEDKKGLTPLDYTGKANLQEVMDVPVLIDALANEDLKVRATARNNLRNIGKPAIAALVEALKDKKLDVRMGAAMTLGMMGPEAKDAAGALADVMKGDDIHIRSYAGWSLTQIDEPPFPIIMELMKDEEPFVRRAIVENLGDIGLEAVTLLIQALKDEDSLVRNYACWGLGNIGPEAKDAIGPLTLMTQDDDKDVRYQAVEALEKIKPTVENPAAGIEDSVGAQVLINLGLTPEKTKAFALTPEKAAERSEFKATLSNGVTVELVGVCEYPSEGKQWWAPDGSLLDTTVQLEEVGRVPVGAYGRQYALLFETDKNEIGFKWGKVEGSTGLRSLIVVDEKGRRKFPPLFLAAKAYIPERDTTSITVGVEYGPREMISRYSVSKDAIIGGKVSGIKFTKPNESASGIQINVLHDYDEGMSYSIIAIDFDGKKHHCSGSIFENIENNKRLTKATFRRSEKLDQLKEFHLQTRPFHWATFKNVSLRPGVKTGSLVAGVDLPVRFIASDNDGKVERYHWRLNLTKAVRLSRNSFIIEGDSIRGYWGSTGITLTSPEDGTNVDYQLIISKEDDKLDYLMRESQSHEVLGGYDSIASSGRKEITQPECDLIRTYILKEPVALSEKYLPLWKRDFIKDGTVIYTLLYAVRIVGENEDDPFVPTIKDITDNTDDMLEIKTPATEVEEITGIKEVYLPNFDGDRHQILDLKSGEVIDLPKIEDDFELFAAVANGKKGEIVYDRSEGRLRIAWLQVSMTDGMIAIADRFNYLWAEPDDLPNSQTIMTRKGEQYKVQFVKADENGCTVKFYPLPGAKTAKVAKPNVQVEEEEAVSIRQKAKVEQAYTDMAYIIPAQVPLDELKNQKADFFNLIEGHVQGMSVEKNYMEFLRTVLQYDVGDIYYYYDEKAEVGKAVFLRQNYWEREHTISKTELPVISLEKLPLEITIGTLDGRKYKIRFIEWKTLSPAMMMGPLRGRVGDLSTTARHDYISGCIHV